MIARWPSMLRVILGVAAVLLMMGGMVAQHAAMIPRQPVAPELPPYVDQSVPLATIDLHTAAHPPTEEEFISAAAWWEHQRQELVDQLTGLLRNESRSTGWTDLYASATADGGHVLVVVGFQGRLGTIRFAGDGTLSACDTTPNAVLPIILPSVDGGFRKPTATDVRSIETRLRYLRERSPVAWHASENEVSVTTEEALTVTRVDRMVSTTDVVLSQGDALFSHRTSRCFSKKLRDRTLFAEVEPPLPVANN